MWLLTVLRTHAARSTSLSEQNERAAALHSKQVKWPEGPHNRSRHGKGGRRGSLKDSHRMRSLPPVATGGHADTRTKGGKSKSDRKSEKSEKRRTAKSPNSSRASTTADQSLNVESLSQGSTGGGSVAAGPLEAKAEAPLGALAEGGSSAAVAQAACTVSAASEAASPHEAAPRNEPADAEAADSGPRAASGRKRWLRMLWRSKAANTGEEVVLRDGQGRDRQVVHLLGAGDLTNGKSEAFGVSAARGNETLLQQDEARRTAAMLKARTRVEAERGGLFRRGHINEHAPVGKRKFGLNLGCF